jgi:DNA replication protein DnaC
MINGYQSKLLDVYSNIRDYEAKDLQKRKKEIRNLYPAILDIDNEIQKLSLKLSLVILKSENPDYDLKEYKNQIMDLKAKKYEMLVSKGYDPEFLNLHYRCNRCQDTGYIGREKCSCFKDKLVSLYYENSLLQDILKTKNFDSFNINLFSPHKTGTEKYSPRRNIENTLEYVLNDYIPNFNSINSNILFFGTPGSGKSFLSYCIAKALLDAGYLVIYKTADELINDLRDVRFNHNSKLEEILLDCDLLIIDDLGAEQKSEFSITELFNLLNKKLLKNKKMLVSTNLVLPAISQIYSERIYSRLVGDFKLYKFYSEDLRITLNLKNNK